MYIKHIYLYSYFLVLTKPVSAYFLVKASFSTNDAFVCCFVLLHQYWGITVPGFPCVTVNRPQTAWGGWILTVHLNYVASYTDLLLFLFERTQQLTLSTTRGKPWRLRVWVGPNFVQSHR